MWIWLEIRERRGDHGFSRIRADLRTGNGKGSLGEGLHSHPWRDEAAPWMEHPFFMGLLEENRHR